MKLLRYGPLGSEKPGLLDNEGQIRDLSGHVADITPAQLSPDALATLAAIDPKSLPIVEGSPRYGVPFSGAGKFIAIGLNYADHAAESNMPIPKEPIVFTKAITSLHGPNDTVVIPKGSKKSDWEVELGIVIGSKAQYVDEANALDHVAGYCVINDVSEREWQIERGGTWDKGKGCDTFGPTGPWLVTTDEVGDPQTLDLWLDLNGRRVQTGNTRTMIFGAATLVSYVSQFMTLMPGDIITTGTPPGVGMGMKPEPVFLKPGDVMTLGIAKLGEQRQEVVAWTAPGQMTVGLAIPCFIDAFFPEVGIASLELLERLGVDVVYPQGQTCCGQPMANNGCQGAARGAEAHFVDLFAGFEAVVMPSGSCVHHLRSHFDAIPQTDSVRHLRANTYELVEYLHDELRVDGFPWAAFPHKVGLHNSCGTLRSLRHASMSELGETPFSKPLDLLSKVPGIEFVTPSRPDECCGFGGTFSVAEDAVSGRMGLDKVRDHAAAGAEYIVSADTSCLMHQQGCARRAGVPLRFIHIAQILNGAPA